MSSKLEYLKKYDSGGANGDGKKKRRKKSSKQEKDAIRGRGGLRIIDDEVDAATIDTGRAEKAWDPEDEEEKPVVIIEDLADAKRAASGSGSWVTVGAGNETFVKHRIVTEDASPLRRRPKHDDDDASPPRRNSKYSVGGGVGSMGGIRSTHDASPPRRRRRHDSSDDDASPPRRNPERSGRGDGNGRDVARIVGDGTSSPRRGRRHDSSDDASPPRRNPRQDRNARGKGIPSSSDQDVRNVDASPPRRMKRHNRSDEDASPPRRSFGDLTSRGKGGRDRVGQNSSLPRRRKRHDSSEEERSSPRSDRNAKGKGTEGRGGGVESVKDSSPPRRDRSSYRSNGNGSSGPDASPSRRRPRDRNNDGKEDERIRIGRYSGVHDSIRDRARDSSPRRRDSKRRAKRSKSQSPVNTSGSDASPRKRNREKGSRSRYESGSSLSRKERRHKSPYRDAASSDKHARGVPDQRNGNSEKGHDADRAKTTSGHYAGLQSGKDFKVVEQELRRKHEAEMKAANTENSGQGAATVYRDRKGRKLDMLNEFMRQQDAIAGKAVEAAEAQYEWGRGKVQKEEAKQWKEEMDNIAAEPFARGVDDARLEAARKAEIRPDDPMAAYVTKKRSEQKVKGEGPKKLEYKGPPPKPNRFGIRPGYRWDGVDRGNGWEEKIQAKAVDTRYKEELAYKWASADM